MAIRRQAWRNIVNVSTALDMRSRRIPSFGSQHSRSQGQVPGTSRVRVPRVLHVLIQQMWALYYISHSLSRLVTSLQPASETVTVSLRVAVPSGIPGVTINPAVNVGWLAEGCTGVRQQAYRPDAVYNPLYCLKSLRRRLLRRDDSSPVVES